MERTLLTLILAGFSAPVFAEPPDIRSSPDMQMEYVVLPPLSGAISLEGGLVGPFSLTDSSNKINGLGFYVGVGWRQFLVPHGEWCVRGYGFFERRALVNNTLGMGLALMVRAFNPRYIYGGASVFLEGGITSAGELFASDSLDGGRVSLGFEFTGGALIGGGYPMFAESGVNVSLTAGSIGGLGYWEVIGRWLVRFDISFRTEIPSSTPSAD